MACSSFVTLVLMVIVGVVSVRDTDSGEGGRTAMCTSLSDCCNQAVTSFSPTRGLRFVIVFSDWCREIAHDKPSCSRLCKLGNKLGVNTANTTFPTFPDNLARLVEITNPEKDVDADGTTFSAFVQYVNLSEAEALNSGSIPVESWETEHVPTAVALYSGVKDEDQQSWEIEYVERNFDGVTVPGATGWGFNMLLHQLRSLRGAERAYLTDESRPLDDASGDPFRTKGAHIYGGMSKDMYPYKYNHTRGIVDGGAQTIIHYDYDLHEEDCGKNYESGEPK